MRALSQSELASDAWVLKPALGRVGADISLAGATSTKDRAKIAKDARRWPSAWIAQPRFATSSLASPDGERRYPCIGVFTLSDDAAPRAIGAYGRLAKNPLIDHRAQDVAVLLEPTT